MPPSFIQKLGAVIFVGVARNIGALAVLLFLKVLNGTQSVDAAAPAPHPPDFVPVPHAVRVIDPPADQ